MKVKMRIVLFMLVISMMAGLTACGGSANTENNFVEEENRGKNGTEVNREELSELLAGGLTEEQFMFVMAHGPKTMVNKDVKMNDLLMLLLHCANWESAESLEVPIHGWEEGEYEPYIYYDVAMVNNMISCLTDFAFSEENNGECMGVTVTGGVLQLNVASPSARNDGTILSAEIIGEEMVVNYEVTIRDEVSETSECRTALLRKNAEGLYQVHEIYAYVEPMEEEWQVAYKDIILGIMREDSIYMFDPSYKDYLTYLPEETSTYHYALHDLDLDGMPELLVKYDRGEIYYGPIKAFTYVDGAVNELGCDITQGIMTNIYVYPEQKGLGVRESDRWSDKATFEKYEIVGQSLEVVETYEAMSGDSQLEVYESAGVWIEWESAFDLNELRNYSISTHE